MVRLNAFSTLEAIFSSVLILTAIAFTMAIVQNVMSSHSNLTKFKAESCLLELENTRDDFDVQNNYSEFNIASSSENHYLFKDMIVITLKVKDQNGMLILEKKRLKKIVP
ncbi:MAG: hypothetical protein RIE58_07765 [Vicingaceae bacterium]